MSTFLAFGVPILLGFICGYFFTIPVNILLTTIAMGIGYLLLWSTRDAELGAIFGIAAIIIAIIFSVALWITIGLTGDIFHGINITWLIRKGT